MVMDAVAGVDEVGTLAELGWGERVCWVSG